MFVRISLAAKASHVRLSKEKRRRDLPSGETARTWHRAEKSSDCQLDAAGSEGNWKICRWHLASGRQPVPAHAMKMKTGKSNEQSG